MTTAERQLRALCQVHRFTLELRPTVNYLVRIVSPFRFEMHDDVLSFLGLHPNARTNVFYFHTIEQALSALLKALPEHGNR